MRALVLKELKTPLVMEQRPDPVAGPGEVVVRIEAAALNRRDDWITKGLYPGVRLPVVLGSDGTGTVEEAAAAAEWNGQPVIINPGWEWGTRREVQSEAFRILGMPDDGTFAERVRVPAEYLHRRPSHLTVHEAAALPLAGVTAFRAVFTQGGLRPGERVLVTGIGGGVATFALQFAAAAGAHVCVTSSSPEKLQRAADVGARQGFLYTDEGWAKQAKRDGGPFDLIIDGAGGSGYARLIELAAPGARIVNYGATAGPPEKLDLFKVFWKQLRLIGSTMGSPDDFAAMLAFVTQHHIRPIIDKVFPWEEANAALQHMRDACQFGKIVLALTS